MNPNLKELYQDLILQHNKNPIRFYEIENPDAILEAYNPICGDRFKVFLKVENNKITEVSFKGYGCAISEGLYFYNGRTNSGTKSGRSKNTFHSIPKVVNGTLAENDEVLSDFHAFSAVRSFPGRMPCVLLAWEELEEWVVDGGQ